MGLLGTLKNYFTGGVEGANKSLIEANPELQMEEAIRNAESELRKDSDAVSRIIAVKLENEEKIKDLSNKMKKIKMLTSEAQRQGRELDVVEGNRLYKERDAELIQYEELVKELEVNIAELREVLKERTSEVESLKSQKAILMAQFTTAKSKEKILDLKSGISNKTSTNFGEISKVINSKVNEVKAKESLAGTSTTGSKTFKGL